MDLSPRRRRLVPAQANRKPTNTHFQEYFGFSRAKLQALALLSFFQSIHFCNKNVAQPGFYIIANGVSPTTLTLIPHDYKKEAGVF